MGKSIFVISEEKDISLKRYEKSAFLRSFILFLGSFILMFLVLGTLYYQQEKRRLTKELEITNHMHYIECMQLQMGDCNQTANTTPDLDPLYNNLLYVLGLVLLLFIPVSLLLSAYTMRPVRKATDMIDNFITNIVHDINTPVATIMLNTKSILKKNTDPSKKLQRILSSTEQLQNMQHDLLALSEEKEQIVMEPIELKSLIEEICENYQLQYPTQPFLRSLQRQNITANRTDMKRILQNLISNAIKYNRNHYPINLYNDANRCLHICDQGRGIAHPQKIFNKHYREYYQIQGSGLGMASVHAMLQRNHIEVVIQSEQNVGTHIILKFSN